MATLRMVFGDKLLRTEVKAVLEGQMEGEEGSVTKRVVL